MVTFGWVVTALVGLGAIVWGPEAFAEHLGKAAVALSVSSFASALLLVGAEPRARSRTITMVALTTSMPESIPNAMSATDPARAPLTMANGRLDAVPAERHELERASDFAPLRLLTRISGSIGRRFGAANQETPR